MKTQKQLSLVSQFLIYQSRRKESVLRKYLPRVLTFDFQVKTNFPVLPLEDLGASLAGSFRSSALSQKFASKFSSKFFSVGTEQPSVLAPISEERTFAVPQPSRKIKRQIDRSSVLELDDLNLLPISQELADFFGSLTIQFQVERDTAVEAFAKVLGARGLLLHERVVLLRVLLNNPGVFQSRKELFVGELLRYAGLKQNGGKGLHYFLRDVVSLFCEWHRESTLPCENPELPQLAHAALLNIFSKLADQNKIIADHNFILFREFLERVRGLVDVDLRPLIKMLSARLPQSAPATSKRDLTLWRYMALNVLELFLEKRIDARFQTDRGSIGSSSHKTAGLAILKALFELMKTRNPYLNQRAANVAGFYFRVNEWALYDAELANTVSNALFSLSSQSPEKFYELLSHLSFHSPLFLLKDAHVCRFLQQPLRRSSNRLVKSFLLCVKHLLDPALLPRPELEAVPDLLRLLFQELLHLLEALCSSFNYCNFIQTLILFKHFLELPFSDKTLCLRRLVAQLGKLSKTGLKARYRRYVHALVLRLARVVLAPPKEDELTAAPRFSEMSMTCISNLNESMMRFQNFGPGPIKTEETESPVKSDE